MRPKQWIKNGLVILAAVFARRADDLATDERVAIAFVAFSLIASAIYIVNDIADRHKDRRHPTKRARPIASGQLSIPFAVCVACLSLLLGAALTALVTTQQAAALAAGARDPFPVDGGSAALFVATIGGYLALNIAYSLWIKHQVLWDVFAIATGFVLRALAGAFVAMVAISPWLYLCTLFLSLFLALGKRRAELVGLSADTRTSLRDYSRLLLDQLMTIVVACTLMTYSLYTFQTPGSGSRLMLTIPIVIFGMFRYLYLVYVKGEGESPDQLLLRDKQLVASVLLCVVLAAAVLYGVIPL
jgi:4-hydroxybenzoate polyprenyltransferase